MGRLSQSRVGKTVHLVIQRLASGHAKKISEQSKRVAISTKDNLKNEAFDEHHDQHHSF